MQLPPINFWVVGLGSVAFVASCATWLVLLARRAEGNSFLPYEPRRSVPWGAIGALLAVLLVGLAVAVPLLQRDPNPLEDMDSAELSQLFGFNTLHTLTITAVFLVLIATASRAGRSDLGVPALYRWERLRRDIRIGTVAWLAALVPVYGVQAALVTALGQESQHPLIQMILKEPSPPLLAVAFVSAVFVAPVCEELTFRLLLQGFLEKWEDESLRQPTESSTDTAAAVDSVQFIADADVRSSSNAYEDDNAISYRSLPLSRGLFGLPHGWLPIGVSSILFALAHFGHGPDPIPLVLLAIILGYTYQRTHRIVPCIVTHMLFNAFSLGALLLLIFESQGANAP